MNHTTTMPPLLTHELRRQWIADARQPTRSCLSRNDRRSDRSALYTRSLLGCIVMLVLVLLASSCSRHPPKTTFLMFAAVSTSDALSELGREFEKDEGVSVQYSFGSSRDLARQIKAGAPVDVFLSADLVTMDDLTTAGLVKPSDRRNLLSNQLVVVIPTNSELTIRAAGDLVRASKVAVGDPSSVPAGVYARTWLESTGTWASLESHVIPTLDVRAALAVVESGNADAGLVYRTDALTSKKTKIAYEVPPGQGPPITYPLARLARSQSAPAQRFIDFLSGPKGRATFARFGFVVL